MVDDDPGANPSQARVSGLMRNVVPDIVPSNVKPMGRTSALRVPHRLLIRRAEKGVPPPAALVFYRSSRIATSGVHKGIHGEWIGTNAGLGGVSRSCLRLESLVLLIPSAA